MNEEISDEGSSPFRNESAYSKLTQSQGFLDECMSCEEGPIWFAKHEENTFLKCGNCGYALRTEDTSKPIDEWHKDVRIKSKKPKNEDEYPKKIIYYSTGANKKLYAKLIVPTKSSGATFTASGWSIGGDIVRRNTSKGEIGEQPYENYVKKFVIYEDRVEIGITFGDMSIKSDNSINQTIKLNLIDIYNIRKQRVGGKIGFVFEANGDVYQFKLARKGLGGRTKPTDARSAMIHLKKAVRNAPEQTSNQTKNTKSEDQEEGDAIEKLSRIKELHDEGVLTDEEFQEKKAELLDLI